MIVKADDVVLFEITEIQKQVLRDAIDSDILEARLKELLFYILNNKYNQSFKKLKAKWEPLLIANGVETVPTDPDAFAALVFQQPNYEDKKTQGT